MTLLESPARSTEPWQQAMQAAFTQPAALLSYLGLADSTVALQVEKLRDFPLRVPLGFAQRMEKGNPNDPLFLQVWPVPAESLQLEGYTQDAVGDLSTLKGSGLVHKYQGRALVIVTGACAVNCRYCFRRHFPYSEQHASRSQWRPLLQEIHADASLSEILLSGGDPLSLSDEKLAELVRGLAEIPHLQRLRVHTRTPIVLPERVTPKLLNWLTSSRLKPVMVLHSNHAQELDHSVAAACEKLRAAGVTLLNQAVLLRGVNDSVATLKGLSERLFAIGVLPYYVNLLDRVQGAAHFEVDEPTAKALFRELAGQLPGYLVPRLTREVAGEPSKTWVSFQ